MIPRAPLPTQRPQPLRRTPSTASASRTLHRPALPSKLSNVNLASQQVQVQVQVQVQGIAGEVKAGRQSRKRSHSYSTEEDVLQGDAEAHRGPEALEVQDTSVASPPSYAANTSLRPADGGDDAQELAPLATPLPLSQLPLPLPSRPANLSNERRRIRQFATNLSNSAPRDALGRAAGLKPPANAIRLPQSRVADFFPWSGMHPEDVLNEFVVKSGFADKALGSNQSESNTARPTLWPTLKNKSGLHVLSALFIQVFDKRQSLGRCTAPSTFKPPPRVTLTDTKREAWLRDLASHDVPLRKLSRTIPHGVRGKILLEQCMSKEISIPRAVWLAKCVGANEIRAFKRKGISGPAALTGELRWVREWTVFVEQFLEATVTSCGQPSWQMRMNYTIRLAAAFFSENLLDADHYLDWLLTSFETSTPERLPIWLVLVQTYWKTLVTQRRRGCRLADAVLSHLDSLATSPHTTTSPQLSDRLQHLFMILAVSHRGCLIAPKSWDRSRDHLDALIRKNPFQQQRDSLNNVVRRNNRLARTLNASNDSRSSKLRLVNLLDSVRLRVDIEALAGECSSIVSDFKMMVAALLEWASSAYREGLARVFLCAHLLKWYKDVGLDIDEAILAFISSTHTSSTVKNDHVYRVIAELTHSGHVAFGRYLQWLISRGSLSGRTSDNDVAILSSVSISSLSPSVENLRKTLLQRLRNSPDEEAQTIESLKSAIIDSLEHAYPGSDSMPGLDVRLGLLPPLLEMPGTVRLTVGHWLSQRTSHWNDTSLSTFDGGNIRLNLANFCAIRDVLERLEDFTSLSSVLLDASASYDPAILSALSDTIATHNEIFAAAGTLPALVRAICDQQRSLRDRQPLDRRFLMSLANLIRHVPAESASLKTITSDLVICEQQNFEAACSPASDNMVAMQSRTLESDQDIERVFASGNSMDENLMRRMFSAIVDRTMKVDSATDVSGTARWFGQLRILDQTTFDQLVQNLFTKMAGAAGKAQFHSLLTALVGSECTSMETILQAFERRMTAAAATGNAPLKARLASHCLQIVLPGSLDGDNRSLESYRSRLAQLCLCREHPLRVLACVRLAVCGSETGDTPYRVCLVKLLRRYAVSDFEHMKRELVFDVNSPPDGLKMSRLIDSLRGDESSAAWSIDNCAERAATSATELSLPMCQLALQLCAQMAQGDLERANLLMTALQSAIEREPPVWPQLLQSFGLETIKSLHTWAASRILNAVTEYIDDAGTLPPNRSEISRYLAVAGIAASASGSRGSDVLQPVMDKLKALTALLTDADAMADRHNDRISGVHIASICFCIQKLLELATPRLQRTLDDTTPLNDCTPFSIVMSGLLTHPKLQLQHQTLEHIFDVACLCSDGVLPEMLPALALQLAPSSQADSRLIFLLGIPRPSHAWLNLASRVHPPASSQTAAMPSPTAQQTSRFPGYMPSQSPAQPQRPPLQPGQSSPGGLGCSSTLPSPVQRQGPFAGPAGRAPTSHTPWGPEIKTAPFLLRQWEIMEEATPNMGENDTSLSLQLFAARKV